MHSETLLEFLSPALPPTLAASLNALPEPTHSLINTLAHLLAAAKCPTDHPEFRTNWDSTQTAIAALITEFKSKHGQTSGQKRTLDTPENISQPAKRARTSPTPDESDDPPLFTLHALSLTAPIRKKADITIHRSSIRLTNPATHAQEHPPIPLSTLRAAFLLPTRGKTKPHWSVLLLPIPTEAKDKSIHLAFGLDAVPSGFVTTSYSSDAEGGERTAHAKGTPALESLRAFLSHLTIPIIEPSLSAFRSSSGEGGVEAYRGAKSGTLWFLPGGILWDGKPAEWYPLSEIARAIDGVDGVRTLSATGRMCSVIVRKVMTAAEKASEKEKEKEREKGRRKGKEKQAEAEGEENEEGDEDGEEVAEIDFGMVDGKEQETISRWVKQHRQYFSKAQESSRPEPLHKPPSSPIKSSATTTTAANGRTRSGRTAAAIPTGGQEGESDESDEDFEASSSDGGSATSDDSSEDEDGNAGSEDVGSKSGSDDEEGMEVDGEEEESEEEEEKEELDPAHHPLLRPGAMPRMTKAALEAVVGMVEADLKMGVGKGGTRGVESEESEEDELED